RIQQSQRDLVAAGARAVIRLMPDCDDQALLSPGLLDISGLENIKDEEIFGPLLQFTRVNSFEQAIKKANDTKYGLSAGLFSDDRGCYDLFAKKIRAGVVNWNRQTTGASGKLPFGGCGHSGNHRPSGYFAADYCSYPVASLESDAIELPQTLLNGFSH
ncbi:MAG: aldehyde dehydrogenase family protein, partial [Planctomycetota bacterium]|nr:aldehyde dehydrogenase family protein [Planctomycetota bacterium]